MAILRRVLLDLARTRDELLDGEIFYPLNHPLGANQNVRARYPNFRHCGISFTQRNATGWQGALFSAWSHRLERRQ